MSEQTQECSKNRESYHGDDDADMKKDRLEGVEPDSFVLVVGSHHQKDNAGNQSYEVAERASRIVGHARCRRGRRRRVPGLSSRSCVSSGSSRLCNRSPATGAEISGRFRPALYTKRHHPTLLFFVTVCNCLTILTKSGGKVTPRRISSGPAAVPNSPAP